MKKVLRIIGLVLLILILSTAAAIWKITRSAGGVENWIGTQLQVVANSYLNPTLAFDSLHYEYPLTVTLKGLRLTAPDPTNPGQMINILGSDSATLSLAEIPHSGQPIVIDKIILDKPLFQAIATKPGGDQFVGFSHLVRSGVSDDSHQPATPDKKLSELFQMKLIQLNDGRVVYDPRIEGTEAMVLDHIYTELDIQPSVNGSYNLKIGLNRKPLFELNASARVNIDDVTVNNMAITLTAGVGGEHENYLPPQLQKVLNEYQVKGDLDIQLTGDLPVMNYKSGHVNLNMILANAFITTGDYKVPIKRARILSVLQNGKLVVPAITIDALKGTMLANGIVTLNDALDSDVHLQVNNMVIDELFVKPGTAEKPKLAGRVKAHINANVSATALMSYIDAANPATQPATTQPVMLAVLSEKWGSGEIHLDHGRLVDIQLVDQFSDVVTKAFSIFNKKRSQNANESADVTFTLSGDQILFPSFDYHGDFVSGHGAGTVTLDKRLDLTVNAGKNSGVVTSVTDQLLTYRVLGTTDAPQFKATTAVGALTNKTTDTVKGAVDVGTEKGSQGVKKGWNWLFGGDK